MTKMFRTFAFVAASIAALALASPADAQSSYVIKDGNGVTRTIKSINCSATICPLSVPTDITGTALTGAAGSPSASAMSIQGVVGGTAVPTTISGTVNVNCLSGCSG